MQRCQTNRTPFFIRRRQTVAAGPNRRAAASARPVHATKPIEAVAAGDRVWAWSEYSGHIGLHAVTRVFRPGPRRVLELHCIGADGAAQRICATLEHPFWVPGKGWTAAAALRPGDALMPLDATAELRVAAVQDQGLRLEVFNFEVKQAHSYFVGTPGVLVHNRSELPGDPTSVSARPLPAYAGDILERGTVGPSAFDWNHQDRAMVAHMQQAMAAAYHLLPPDPAGMVSLSNGQEVPALIRPGHLDLSAPGGTGSQKVFRLLAAEQPVPYRMGISINQPGIHPRNLVYEAAMYEVLNGLAPSYRLEHIVAAVQPRVETIGNAVGVAFDRDLPDASLGLGLVMEASPARSRTHKLKSYLDLMIDTVNGQPQSPLMALPGWDFFGPNPSAAKGRNGVITYSVLSGDWQPLLAAFKAGIDRVAPHFPDLDEGARAAIEGGRRMVNEKGFAVGDLQTRAMRLQPYVLPWNDSRIVNVNHGIFDPGALLQQNVLHPLADADIGIEGIAFSFTETSRQNLIHWDLAEAIVDARTRHSREPARVYGFIEPAVAGFQPVPGYGFSGPRTPR